MRLRTRRPKEKNRVSKIFYTYRMRDRTKYRKNLFPIVSILFFFVFFKSRSTIGCETFQNYERVQPKCFKNVLCQYFPVKNVVFTVLFFFYDAGVATRSLPEHRIVVVSVCFPQNAPVPLLFTARTRM